MACEMFSKVIRNSRTILWNGPMGVFEMEGFQHGTKMIAQALQMPRKKAPIHS
jgi:phosphoglycerate kinase